MLQTFYQPRLVEMQFTFLFTFQFNAFFYLAEWFLMQTIHSLALTIFTFTWMLRDAWKYFKTIRVPMLQNILSALT